MFSLFVCNQLLENLSQILESCNTSHYTIISTINNNYNNQYIHVQYTY